MLRETFNELILQYTSDQELETKCWIELERSYSGKGRHYHTLQHLEDLLRLLVPI